MSVILNIIAAFDDKGIKKAEQAFKQLQNSSDKAQYAITKAAVPATAALAGLAATTVVFAKAAAAEAGQMALLATQLRNSTGATAEQSAAVDAQLVALSRVSAVADDELRPALAALSMGTKDVSKSQALLSTVLDVSAGTGKSATDVAMALSRAYQGNFKGIKSLSPEIARMVKDHASFADIVKVLNTQYGGMNQTFADSAAGGFAKMQIALDEAKESIGLILLPIVVKMADAFRAFGEWAERNKALIVTLGLTFGLLATGLVAANIALNAWKAVALITTGINYAFALSLTAVQVATGIGIGVALAGAAAFVIIKNKMNDARGAALDLAGANVIAINSQKDLNKFIGPVSSRDFDTFKRNARSYASELAALGAYTDKSTDKQTKAAAAAAKKAEALRKAKDAAEAYKKELQDLAQVIKDKLNVRLDDAKDKLKAAQDAFDNYAKSVGSSVTEAFNFGNAQSDAAGNATDLKAALAKQAEAQIKVNDAYNKWSGFQDKDNMDALTMSQRELAAATDDVAIAQAKPMTFFENLAKQAEKAKKFGELVSRLIAGGLSETALSQVLAAGVDGGTAIATEILDSADGILKANTLTQSMTDLADQMGKKAAGKYYQAGVDSATSFLKGIQDTVDKVDLILSNPNLTMTDIINAGLLESGLTTGFSGIPDISGFDMTGILSGINFGMGTLMADGGVVTRATSIIAGEAGPEAIIPLDRLGSMGMGGGMNITVNAGLVSTPDQVGQEIIQAILKSQRRSGAVFAPATGISY
jgi:hypothetical protein